MNILISACILGIHCRYDGSEVVNDFIISHIGKHNFIPICPEQLGGLKTPREPSEILRNAVLSKSGEDITQNYIKGAAETLKIAKMLDCKYAILKDRSPSCGAGIIYDGTFSGKRIAGNGITAELLIKNGITVILESQAESCDFLWQK
ncbi:MAG: DUF523 domain-containing protein [Clostridia bacterium]|nr:DUF523 domain-containing protein [Clostridia bacterium]